MAEKGNVHVKTLSAEVKVSAPPPKTTIELGLDAVRLAVLALIVTVALGFASLGSTWEWKLGLGSGSFLAVVALVFFRWPRHWLMTAAQKIVAGR